jgi:hypothetical protein
MTNTDKFFQRLSEVEAELRKVCVDFSDLHEDYMGTEFPEQEILVGVKLDNLISDATDGICSHLDFLKRAITDLIRFIDFRKKYKHFSDNDLELIIDSDNDLANFKLNLASMNLEEKKAFLDSLKNLRFDWNEVFNNRQYSKLKKAFTT